MDDFKTTKNLLPLPVFEPRIVQPVAYTKYRLFVFFYLSPLPYFSLFILFPHFFLSWLSWLVSLSLSHNTNIHAPDEIQTRERQQTHALDLAATGIGLTWAARHEVDTFTYKVKRNNGKNRLNLLFRFIKCC